MGATKVEYLQQFQLQNELYITGDYSNLNTWANHNGWPIKNSHFLFPSTLRWALSESIFSGAQYVNLHSKRFYEEKSKCASLALESGHWLSASLHESLWCVPAKKPESNKYDLVTPLAQCFWSAHHDDWSRWFAISSPQTICWPQCSLMGGVAKKYIT